MGFVLTIARGAGAGEEFTFDREARLGRTSDNDVVIRDSSASRSHARVFFKGGRHFVEDLGSANGTQVNSAAITAPKELKNGDSVTIGDVVLTFARADPTALQPDVTQEVAGADVNETAIPPPRSRPTARRAANASGRAHSQPEDDDETGAAPPDEPEPPEDEDEPAANEEPAEDESAEAPEPEASDDDEGDGEVPAAGVRRLDNRTARSPRPKSLARAAPVGPARQPIRGSGMARAKPQADDDELSGMTAAAKARRRRELEKSASGRVQLLWDKLGPAARVGVALFGVLLVVALAGGGGWMIWQQSKGRPRKAEPATLTPNAPPITDSFGAGAVTFQRPDLKSFTFNVTSPTKVVGVLHYQARGISKEEVSVSLNGHELGDVPPDSLDVETREQFLVLPAAHLVLRADNTLIFDNVLNPPGEDEWRVWNVWVEIIPVPDMTTDEAARAATDAIEKGAKAYELRDVGAGNLFHSWKTYREAWLLLEATPNRNDELHQIAFTRMMEIRPELDRRCSAMLVEFKKVINQRPRDENKARTVLREIPDYFPTREHPCNTFSSSLLAELDEVAAPEQP